MNCCLVERGINGTYLKSSSLQAFSDLYSLLPFTPMIFQIVLLALSNPEDLKHKKSLVINAGTSAFTKVGVYAWTATFSLEWDPS